VCVRACVRAVLCCAVLCCAGYNDSVISYVPYTRSIAVRVMYRLCQFNLQ